MITVTAYNPAKSPMSFGSAGKSKKVNPHVSAVRTPAVAYKNKSAIQSVKTFFKALPLALGLGAMAPAFQSCDPVDIGPITPPTEELSPTQKQFATIINTMYGSGEEGAAKAKSLAPSATNDLSYLPDTLITETPGTSERQIEIFDKINKDTIRSNYTVIDTYDNSVQMSYGKKYYIQNGILIEDVPKFNNKIPMAINKNGNVVKTYFSHPYEYIKESNTKTIEKVLSNGKENIIRVIKKI